MRKDGKLKLSRDRQEDMISEIKDHFRKERGEDIGDLAAALLLGFITERIAPEFYNMGVHDAYSYMGERLEEMLDIQR